jgi:hypothetical protein
MPATVLGSIPASSDTQWNLRQEDKAVEKCTIKKTKDSPLYCPLT